MDKLVTAMGVGGGGARGPGALVLSVLCGVYGVVMVGWRVGTHELTFANLFAGERAAVSMFFHTSLCVSLAVTHAVVHFEVARAGVTGAVIEAGLAVVAGWLIHSTYTRFIVGPAPPAHRLQPRRMATFMGAVPRSCIITGANTGIGYETAKAMAKTGARVVMACRSAERALAARERLLEEVPDCSGSDVVFLPLDLGSLASVRAFVDKFRALEWPLHCLVNNAGLMLSERRESVDGIEMTMAANHFGHFLLTKMLLTDLAKPEVVDPRVVVVSSSLHKLPRAEDLEENLMSDQKDYTLFDAYGKSKLANLLFASELKRQLTEQGSKISVIALHPGNVRTEVTRNMHWLMQLGNRLSGPILGWLQKTPAQGAYSTLHAMTAPHKTVDGQYLVNTQPSLASPPARDRQLARRFWQVTEHIVDDALARLDKRNDNNNEDDDDDTVEQTRQQAGGEKDPGHTHSASSSASSSSSSSSSPAGPSPAAAAAHRRARRPRTES